MEARGKHLESMVLENGLHIYFYDQSRPVMGDRYLVQLLIDIPIPLNTSIFQNVPEAKATSEAFMAHFGPALHYQQTKTRHFVPKQDVSSTLSELRHEFTSAGLPYLHHPDFGQRYVLKIYTEWSAEERCRLAHTQAIQAAESKSGQ